MKDITLNISGMTCGHCAKRVEDALRGLDGVSGVKVDLAGKKAEVAFDETRTDAARMADAVRDAGYEVTG